MMRCRFAGVSAAALVAALALPAAAHDGGHAASPAPEQVAALPFPVEIEADFTLVDQQGRARDAKSFGGRPLLLFFGYASCESICPVALDRMAEAVDLCPPEVVPVLVTVDPERDTPEVLRSVLADLHPRFVGLTGSEAALAAARAPFQVVRSPVAEAPDGGGPVYAHGSFLYLIGPEGRVRAVLPPVLSAERLAELMRRHLE